MTKPSHTMRQHKPLLLGQLSQPPESQGPCRGLACSVLVCLLLTLAILGWVPALPPFGLLDPSSLEFHVPVSTFTSLGPDGHRAQQ